MSQGWIIVVSVFVSGVVEERHELVILFVAKGIVGVTVTLHTGERRTHQRFPRGVHAIDHSSRSELFVICSAFIVGHRVSMKRSGQVLIVGRVRKQVARELFDEK